MIINMPGINDHEQLAANRERMIVKLRSRLDVLEDRYDMPSSRVHAAIDQGIVREKARGDVVALCLAHVLRPSR
jgi:hypothetical protein